MAVSCHWVEDDEHFSHLLDVQAMVKDRKLNSMLLPASKLKQMLRSYEAFGQLRGARCAFRVPNKRLW